MKPWQAQSQTLGITRRVFASNGAAATLTTPGIHRVVRPGDLLEARTSDEALAVIVTIQPAGSAFERVTLDLQEVLAP